MQIKANVICGVYLIVCTSTGEMYVGSSVDVLRRWRQHRNQLRKRTSNCTKLQAAWDTHPGKLSFAVLRTCDETVRHKLEQEYIDRLRPALNSHPAAGTAAGFRFSPEQRERLKSRPQSRVTLYDFSGEQLSVPEIAAKLGITPAAIYSRLRAGRGVRPRVTNDFTTPIEVLGKLLTPREIAEQFDLPLTTIYSRLRAGWTGSDLVQARKHRGRNS